MAKHWSNSPSHVQVTVKSLITCFVLISNPVRLWWDFLHLRLDIYMPFISGLIRNAPHMTVPTLQRVVEIRGLRRFLSSFGLKWNIWRCWWPFRSRIWTYRWCGCICNSDNTCNIAVMQMLEGTSSLISRHRLPSLTPPYLYILVTVNWEWSLKRWNTDQRRLNHK